MENELKCDACGSRSYGVGGQWGRTAYYKGRYIKPRPGKNAYFYWRKCRDCGKKHLRKEIPDTALPERRYVWPRRLAFGLAMSAAGAAWPFVMKLAQELS